MTQKKKVAIGVLIGTAVMASVFAVAANITVTPQTLGAGGDAVTTCDGAVGASYTTAYSSTAPAGYKVTEVKVTGLDEACADKNYKVQFTTSTPSAGTETGAEQTGTVATHGTGNFVGSTLTHSLTGTGTPIPASGITGVYIVFSG